jgi:hypothetical protein
MEAGLNSKFSDVSSLNFEQILLIHEIVMYVWRTSFHDLPFKTIPTTQL